MENNVSNEKFLEFSKGLILALRSIREDMDINVLDDVSGMSDKEMNLYSALNLASQRICSIILDLGNVNGFIELRSNHFDFIKNFVK